MASQGTSSLDFGNAKDWMATRLPEAVRLGITADQLVTESAPSDRAAETAVDSSNAWRRASSRMADLSGTVLVTRVTEYDPWCFKIR